MKTHKAHGWVSVVMALLAISTPADGAPESKMHNGRVRNLPDIEVTAQGVLTIDQEVNLYASSGISNTTVDYGLPNGWNVGISLLNAQFYAAGSHGSAFQPDVLLNLEKHFRIGRSGNLVTGAQTGAGVLPQGAVAMNYSYVDWQWHGSRLDVDLGAYYANAALAGRDSVGWHLNVEGPLPGGSRLIGDYLSGSNGLSGATVKLLYPIAPAWSLGFGVQIPGFRSGNDYSGLLGLYWH